MVVEHENHSRNGSILPAGVLFFSQCELSSPRVNRTWLRVLVTGTKESKKKGKSFSFALGIWYDLCRLGPDIPVFTQVLRIGRMQLLQAGYPWLQVKEEVVALFQHCGPIQHLGV